MSTKLLLCLKPKFKKMIPGTRSWYWPGMAEKMWGDPAVLPDCNRAADTSHSDLDSLASSACLFYSSATPDPPLPPLSLSPTPHLSTPERKYKGPLQTPLYMSFICIISTLLQVNLTAVPMCYDTDQNPSNRCDNSVITSIHQVQMLSNNVGFILG